MDIDIVDYRKNARKSDFSAQTFAYIIFLLYFCSDKSNGTKKKNKTMFGVKSSNQPISGQFAEDFCRNLLQVREQQGQGVNEMSHNIICD